MGYSPIFESIMQKLRSLPESEYDTLHNRKLFVLAVKHAQPEFIDLCVKDATEKGLFPKATHCDDDGNAVYSLEEMAAHFRQTREQATEAMNELFGRE